MTNTTDAAASEATTTLESLRNQSSHLRRARPPDLSSNGGEKRVPLRADAQKLHRRESRLGLRSLFGRNKSTNDPDGAGLSSRDQPSKIGGLRASIADISGWHYGSQGTRSELSLSLPSANQSLKHKKSASAVKSSSVPIAAAKSPIATWNPPPLFKAYPQAVKHARLPACTLSAETILRLQSRGGSISMLDSLTLSALNLDAAEETAAERSEKSKKRHRRNNLSGSSLEWTTKIYVLATSGYLLQYSGQGSFDRFPEKILHLGKDSAAFATDVIPGRHWVLQVSSATDADGALPTSHSTSLLSRLPFRGPEKRSVPNLLLVFESADDMDSWIATLRREIEALGGKKNLSETGTPKLDDEALQLRSQTSQRTLVVRDPDRFSRVLSPDLHWEHGGGLRSPEIHLDNAEIDVREVSFDETSSASGYSQDGRQLEALRDSGLRDSSNRLSFISSGQRTMVTSPGSSPACSPVRDSFASMGEDLILSELLNDGSSRPRPRPNAALINDRRQSMQTMNHLELRVASATMPRPHSTVSNPPPSGPLPQVSPVQTTPNFSVPNGTGKRYSLLRGSPVDTATLPPQDPVASTRVLPSKSTRRPPPTALAINPRPLSFVQDQPSPMSPPPPLHGTPVPTETPVSPSVAPDSPSMFSAWKEQQGIPPKEQVQEMSGHMSRSAGLAHPPHEFQVTVHGHTRRRSSVGSSAERYVSDQQQTRSYILPDVPIPPLPSSMGMPMMRDPIPRSKSSLGYWGRSRSPAPPSARRIAASPRFSLQPDISAITMTRGSQVEDSLGLGFPQFDPRDLPARSRTPSLKPTPRMSTSVQHLRVDSFNKVILQRRSMSHLAADVGPPPAPPPTCALPPLPPKFGEERKGALAA